MLCGWKGDKTVLSLCPVSEFEIAGDRHMSFNTAQSVCFVLKLLTYGDLSFIFLIRET